MPKERVDIDTGKSVWTYTIEEAGNIAARMMATSDCELGIFALGFMAGMALADPKFNQAPIDKSVEQSSSFGTIAQAMCLIEDDYIKSKRACVMEETERGPAFLEAKHTNVKKMLAGGREIIAEIEKFLKDKIDERVGEYEKVMVDNLKEKIEKEN